MVERPDQDAAGVRASRLRPVPQDGGEVAGVAGDEDPPLTCRQLQHVGVVEPFQRRDPREGQHVVPVVAKWVADPPRRKVRVQEEPHSLAVAPRRHLDERVEGAELFHGSAVVGNELVDFVGVFGVVGKGEADLALGEVRLGHQALG